MNRMSRFETFQDVMVPHKPSPFLESLLANSRAMTRTAEICARRGVWHWQESWEGIRWGSRSEVANVGCGPPNGASPPLFVALAVTFGSQVSSIAIVVLNSHVRRRSLDEDGREDTL